MLTGNSEIVDVFDAFDCIEALRDDDEVLLCASLALEVVGADDTIVADDGFAAFFLDLDLFFPLFVEIVIEFVSFSSSSSSLINIGCFF